MGVEMNGITHAAPGTTHRQIDGCSPALMPSRPSRRSTLDHSCSSVPATRQSRPATRPARGTMQRAKGDASHACRWRKMHGYPRVRQQRRRGHRLSSRLRRAQRLQLALETSVSVAHQPQLLMQ